MPFPVPHPPKDVKYKFQYERPTSIKATGSYLLKTATRTDKDLAIDLVVMMPKIIFQEKDYLNYRYFHKRAYYVACLAAGIKKSKDPSFRLSFDCLNGNQLQPIIKVHQGRGVSDSDSSGSSWCINIIVSSPEDVFPESKLLLHANCIRPKGDDATTGGSHLTPTPFYNSTLRSDATVTSYLKLLHASAGNCDAFKDACILGRIWLKQRGFASQLRKGGFGNFEWATLMALLMQPNPGSRTPPLSPGYSSYQLFKATLQFLAQNDLSKKPFSFQTKDVVFPKAGNIPVFFDGARGLNILFKMTPWSYAQLQLEASATLNMLGDTLFDQFDSTFIIRTDLNRYRYDATMEVPLASLGFEFKDEEYEGALRDLCHRIYTILKRALTDRVIGVDLLLPSRTAWPISKTSALSNRHDRLLINLVTDPSNANRTVDHGPSAENKQEAASFRKFWGEKSELRRFRDGSILESVVWTTKDSSASVLEQIILYILSRHVNMQVKENATFTYNSMAHLVPSGHLQGQSGIALFAPIMNAFTTVEKNIRELEGLPLQIRHIRAADPQLRYSSIEYHQNEPASIILQFEASARWPDDLCAIQRTKIALLLKLSEVLSETHEDHLTRVGLENPSQPSQNQVFLDITSPTGIAFRLRIHHDREITLLERQLKDKSLDTQSRESAAVALALHNRDFLHVLSHTQAIQNLCTRYAALSPAIRLMKRWFASHLLTPHIAPELVELFVVRTFLQPHPWTVPSCATTAFLRTLFWISRWDWRHSPLIVDFSPTSANGTSQSEIPGSGKMKAEDVEKIQTRFEAWRRIDPAMNRVVIFAATNIDTDGNTWTDRGRPEKVVAARMTALAKAATNVIRDEEDKRKSELEGKESPSIEFTPETLFVPQMQDFDFVINISSKYSKNSKRRKEDITFKNIEIQKVSGSQDTVTQLTRLFAEDLQSIYDDSILWFWDSENLRQIAGLWNPIVTAQRTFKVKAGWSSVPVQSRNGEKNTNIQINKEAIYNEILRLGGDLVNGIDVK